MEDKTILYSVRYPSAQEEGERIKVRGDRQAAEAKLTEFLRRMREERTYEPIPGREEKGRRFAALAWTSCGRPTPSRPPCTCTVPPIPGI